MDGNPVYMTTKTEGWGTGKDGSWEGMSFYLSSFWDMFKELPENKLEEIKGQEYVLGKGCQDITPTIELSEAVKKAKEELRNHISLNSNTKFGIDTIILCKNLLDALDQSKDPMDIVKDALKDEIKKMKEFNKNLDQKYPNCKEKIKSSIWKSPNDLPKFNKEVGYPDVLIRFNDGNVRFGRLEINRFPVPVCCWP